MSSFFLLLRSQRREQPVARRVPEGIRNVQRLRVRPRESAARALGPDGRGPRAAARARHRQRSAALRGGRAEAAEQHARLAVPGHHAGRERAGRAGDSRPQAVSVSVGHHIFMKTF